MTGGGFDEAFVGSLRVCASRQTSELHMSRLILKRSLQYGQAYSSISIICGTVIPKFFEERAL